MSDTPTETFELNLVLGGASFHASGPTDSVFDALTRFETLLSAEPRGAIGGESGSPEPEQNQNVKNDAQTDTPADSGPVDGRPKPTDAVPLKVFLHQKKLPRGNHGIALGIMVWATKFDSATDVPFDAARRYWGRTGEKLPGNLARDFRRAVTEGWLEEPADRTFRLTGYGETVFDDLDAAGS